MELLGKFQRKEFTLLFTFLNGQCFNWKDSSETLNGSIFIGVLGHAVLKLEQREKLEDASNEIEIYYEQLNVTKVDKTVLEKDLRVFFNLDSDISISRLSEEWSSSCPNMKAACLALHGMRILQQDPFECLISFITSSNNNISRISSLLFKLRERYGTKIEVQSNQSAMEYFTFPTIDQLKTATEADLRTLGFGYRAKFIRETTHHLDSKGGLEYLLGLRAATDVNHVRQELLKFHGIGRKVADCVMLFSLNFPGVVPVDTHVRKVANRYYGAKIGKNKTLTDTDHESISHIFQDRFGPYSGWAHSYLFAAELKQFKGDVLQMSPSKRKRTS